MWGRVWRRVQYGCEVHEAQEDPQLAQPLIEALARAQQEGHAAPPVVVDGEHARREGGAARAGGHRVVVEVPSLAPPRGELAQEDLPPRRLGRAHALQQLHLGAADGCGRHVLRRLHGR